MMHYSKLITPLVILALVTFVICDMRVFRVRRKDGEEGKVRGPLGGFLEHPSGKEEKPSSTTKKPYAERKDGGMRHYYNYNHNHVRMGRNDASPRMDTEVADSGGYIGGVSGYAGGGVGGYSRSWFYDTSSYCNRGFWGGKCNPYGALYG